MSDKKLLLKKADLSDALFLFNLVNDPEVRDNSFSNDDISYDIHIEWFKNKLQSDDCIIFILYKEDVRLAQIRLENINNRWRISYSVESSSRGKGYGTYLLNAIKDMGFNHLFGEVKYSNVASCKSFEKAGYNKIMKDDCIEYEWKKL